MIDSTAIVGAQVSMLSLSGLVLPALLATAMLMTLHRTRKCRSLTLTEGRRPAGSPKTFAEKRKPLWKDS